MRSVVCLLAVLAAAMLAGCGSPGRGTTAARGPVAYTINSALLARVQAVYRHVAAVEKWGPAEDGFRWTYFLQHGVITDVQQRESLPLSAHVTQIRLSVGYPDGQAYDSPVERWVGYQHGHPPAPKCWVPDPVFWHARPNLSGARFPNYSVSRVAKARRVGNVWLLPVVHGGQPNRLPDRLRIDAKTLLVKTLVYHYHYGNEYFRSLAQAPTLPTPRPLCRK